MELIQRISFLAFLFILAACTSAGEQEYILPEPDYRPENTSKPCINGTITGIEKDNITVSGINHHGNDVTVEIVVRGSVFTVYGGYVPPSQLKEGIKLKVWYQGSSCDQPAQPIASARIIIASKRPGDDWP